MNNFIPKRIGSLHPNIAPYWEKIITCDKKEYLLAIGTEKQFKDFAKFIGLDNEILIKFDSNQKRVENRLELLTHIQHKVSSMNSAHFFNSCIELNIPIGEVKTMKDVFKNPVAKKMVLEEKIKNQQTKRIATIAFTIKG